MNAMTRVSMEEGTRLLGSAIFLMLLKDVEESGIHFDHVTEALRTSRLDAGLAFQMRSIYSYLNKKNDSYRLHYATNI
jgi:hypothetical protein